MACMFYFARCMNIIVNSLLAQLVKYDVHTKSIHAIFIIYYYFVLLTVIFHCLMLNVWQLLIHFGNFV